MHDDIVDKLMDLHHQTPTDHEWKISVLKEAVEEIIKLRGQVELLMLAMTTHNNVHEFLDKKVKEEK